MFDLKQSTAWDDSFFAHDANGDAVTGLLDAGWTKRIKKGSGAFAAMTVTITEEENGWYKFTGSTAHSDTVAMLSITFKHASCKQVNLKYKVTARVTDDLPANNDSCTLSNTGIDAIFKRDMAAITGESSRSLLNAIRFLRNKWFGTGSDIVITKEDDSTEAWRTTVTRDGAAQPIVSSDPT